GGAGLGTVAPAGLRGDGGAGGLGRGRPTRRLRPAGRGGRPRRAAARHRGGAVGPVPVTSEPDAVCPDVELSECGRLRTLYFGWGRGVRRPVTLPRRPPFDGVSGNVRFCPP